MPSSPATPFRPCSRAAVWPWRDRRPLVHPIGRAKKNHRNLFVDAGHSALRDVAYMNWRRQGGRRRRPMTPEERNLVIELFDRLATLEDAQRDPEAERLIRDGLRQAPNALYALVQTVLGQDEALKRADARIPELESASAAEAAPRDQSFLGGVRGSVSGKREGRGAVPGVRRGEAAQMAPAGQPAAEPMQPMPAGPAGAPAAPGGSFLGTAAAAAAGVIGGSLLLSGIRSMMGHQQGAHAAFDPASGASGSAPLGGGGTRGAPPPPAGVDDVGRASSSGDDTGRRDYGLLDEGRSEDMQDDQDADDLDDDFGFDDGGDGGDDL